MVSGQQLPILQQIRKAIRASAPDVRESIRCGMLDHPGLANLAARKQWVALYVAPAVLEAHERSFPGVDAGRSCLRFRRLDQVDVPAPRGAARRRAEPSRPVGGRRLIRSSATVRRRA
jgi:hypothetical protein